MAIILGIDPGSLVTGYGVIDVNGQQACYVASGCIRLHTKNLAEKMKYIFEGLTNVTRTHGVDEFAIEQVFVHVNPLAALKLGQARGAAIAAVSQNTDAIHEYSAKQVKKSVVGYGSATKEQVQKMVLCLLNLSGKLQADAADALAVALCHAQTQKGVLPKHMSSRMRGGRMA